MSDFGKARAIVDADDKSPMKQPNQDVAALFTNLKLQHGHYQPFTRRQNVKVPLQIAEAPTKEAPAKEAPTKEAPAKEAVPRTRTHVGFFSPAGGSGKSFLASGVGSLLCRQGKRVLLVDASPLQSLAFHFGATEARDGRRTFFAPGLPKLPVHLLYCGDNQSSFPDLKEFDSEIAVDYVMFDLSGVTGELLITYLRECDYVVVPLLPDPLSIRISANVLATLDRMGAAAPQVRFVLNNMDESPLAKDVHEALVRFLGNQLFHSVIWHQDEVRKAVKEGIVLPFYAPESQASVVLGEIARSLLTPEKQAMINSRWIEG